MFYILQDGCRTKLSNYLSHFEIYGIEYVHSLALLGKGMESSFDASYVGGYLCMSSHPL